MGFIVFLVFILIAVGLVSFVFWKPKLEDPNGVKRKFLDELWSNGKITDDVYKEYIKKL